MSAHPPTVFVVHPKERRKKCTLEPLRGHEGFVFWKYPRRGPKPLDGYIQLGFDGPEISPADAQCGLLILDGTWRFADAMLADYEDVPVRSLPAWKTAYPRVSKLFDDPDGGLATIEALWLAYHLLGRPTQGLLEGYHWADEFLEINGISEGEK